MDRPGESVARRHQPRMTGPVARAQAARAEGPGPFDGPPVAAVRFEGGCLCGAVRYALTGWPEVVNCHCRTCRRMSGAAFSTWATVPAGAFRFLAGDVVRWRSSDRAERGACPRCGSLVTMVYDGGTEVSVTLGSLDEEACLRPQAGIWRADRLPWADDGLPGWPGDAPPGAMARVMGGAMGRVMGGAMGETPRAGAVRPVAGGTFAPRGG